MPRKEAGRLPVIMETVRSVIKFGTMRERLSPENTQSLSVFKLLVTGGCENYWISVITNVSDCGVSTHPDEVVERFATATVASKLKNALQPSMVLELKILLNGQTGRFTAVSSITCSRDSIWPLVDTIESYVTSVFNADQLPLLKRKPQGDI